MKKHFEYKWVIAAACFLMIFTCLGFCSSNFGLYLSGITEAWGFKRSLYSLTSSIRFVTNSVVSIFFGAIIHKFGMKRSLIFGVVVAISALLVNANATTLPGFYLGGFLLGLGLSFTGTAMSSCLIRQWFTSDIGKITGIVLASNGLGGALAAQIITPLIFSEEDPFGYQKAYLIAAAIVAFVGILLLIFIRENKDSAAPVTPGKKTPKKNAQLWSGIPLSQAKSRPYFYTTLLCTLLTGMLLQTLGTIRSVHLKDIGIDTGIIATIASIGSILLTCGKLTTGFLFDKTGLRNTLLVCQGAAILSVLMLLIGDTSPVGTILIFVSVPLLSLATPMQTIIVPLATSDIFGSHSYEKILGLMVAANTAGYAIGSPIANLVYDIRGSYDLVFIACIFLFLLVMALYQYTIRASLKEKNAILAAEQQ